MRTVSANEPTTRLHHALGTGRRAELVHELEAAGTPLHADELARRVGVHPNTVRFHLGVLARAGVVSSQPAVRTTPGRPRIVYSLERSLALEGRDEYRLLATVLASMVSRTASGSADAEAAGRTWGRELVRGVEQPPDEEAAIEHVVSLLVEQGFEPTADHRVIEMHRCPFHDLAETSPDVVCALHRGLISGALAELGQDLTVDELEIFPRPDVCVAWLGVRE